jgi:hypothetical protein
MKPLERKLDARNGHVQFDEREVETECMAGYSGTGNRKGWFNSYGLAYTLLRHFSTLQTPQKRRVRARGLQEIVQAGYPPPWITG